MTHLSSRVHRCRLRALCSSERSGWLLVFEDGSRCHVEDVSAVPAALAGRSAQVVRLDRVAT